MSSTTFLTFDTKNAKDNGSLSGLQPSSVIAMAYQAAGMSATAEKSIQLKVCCNSTIDFLRYPLEACENSCYHNNAMLSNDFCHCWLCEQEPGFARAGFLLFVISAGSKAAVMIPCFYVLLKGLDAVSVG